MLMIYFNDVCTIYSLQKETSMWKLSYSSNMLNCNAGNTQQHSWKRNNTLAHIKILYDKKVRYSN